MCIEEHNRSFSEIISEIISETNIPLERYMTPEEKIKNMRAMKQKLKTEIEITKKKSVERTYENCVSLAQRQKMRLQESFETNSECKTRSEKEEEERRNYKRSQLDHVGDTSKWYLEDCIEYVSNLPDGSYLYYTDLARNYGIKNENGDFLKNGGQKFKTFWKTIILKLPNLITLARITVADCGERK